QGISALTYFLDNLYYVVLHGAIGVIVFLLQMTRYREQQRQALLLENQRTELAFLRSQINPHFLFNTLNNVYSLFFQRSEKALQVIERLTVMLRYGLYEKAERVPLKKEVEHLLNFIELEKLRYDYEPALEIDLPETMDGVMVPPLLLIPFVENAFKHGDLRKKVTIQLAVQEDFLDFKVANFTKVQQKDQVGGIGLDNLRKRLALLYGDQQSLHLTHEDDYFAAHLRIG
ncbi:MAG: histidine kinase, partial [Bacteroidota bacterium]